MMDVEVLELCTRTVTRIPTTSPATGLDRMALSLKMSPATFPAEHKLASFGILLNPSPDLLNQALPPASWKAELSTSREQTKRYRKPSISGTLRSFVPAWRNF